jgi:hypothetical protein
MSQLNVPLERPQQQFGAASPLIAQTFNPAPDWGSSAAGLLPMRRPADGILFSPVAPQNQIGGQITNALLSNMPQMGPLGPLLQQLYAMVQQLLGALGAGANQSENAYADATASSTGDPHLAFNGTQATGQTQSARFDSMVGHSDLLDSDSFAGGYQVSTQVTAPNANGVTTNQCATISTDCGGTRVCLDRTGAASITENGQAVAIASGQTLDLGNGETVTKNTDGSLSVINVNGQGATINTTLRATGSGVNVSTTAHDADLGGDIVNAAQPAPQPPPVYWHPGMQRYM